MPAEIDSEPVSVDLARNQKAEMGTMYFAPPPKHTRGIRLSLSP